MSLQRQIVGSPELYRGSTITVRLLGPDYICYVDDVEMSAFYLTPGAAVSGGQRYVNERMKERGK